MRTLHVITIGVCGALYASFGYLTHLGLVPPIFGVVRFWPSVVIPAVFSILFGPLVGGFGAALGIFLSDMAIHGDALLSLTVGVPSNFLGFYLLGYFGQKKLDKKILIIGLIAGIAFAFSSIILYSLSLLPSDISLFFIGVSVSCLALTLGIIYLTPNWRSVNIASVIGLGVGSLWIGIGVWAYSQFFVLPSQETHLPFSAALVWFIWTYFTEIPFLLLLVPPILKACYTAFSSLRPKETIEIK